MNRTKYLAFLFGITSILSACTLGDDTRYPCKGQYGSQKIIDTIKSTFNLGIVMFNNYYRDSSVSCDTIRMDISDDGILDSLNEETLMETISKFFFSDTANTAVKYLKVTVRDYGAKNGAVEAVYMLDRKSATSYQAFHIIPDCNFEYEIIKTSKSTAHSASETWERMTVDINLATDCNHVKVLADEIKEKYKTDIREKAVDEFSINFHVQKPNNKYCVSKKYSIFYNIRNKNL